MHSVKDQFKISTTVIQRKAFVFKLKPDGACRRKLSRFCGCARFVYNRGLAWNKECREKDPTFKLSYSKLCALLPEWKKELPWLADCHSQVLQQALRDLEAAFKNFFEGRSGFPKFHKKGGSRDAFRYPQGFKIDEGRRQVYLPCIGWVNYRRSRFIEGKPKNITVSRKADGWYVSIQTECEVAEPVHPMAGVEVGADVGVKKFLTLSDGTVYMPLNSLKRNLQQLAKLQRRLKRMKKFGRNWRKLQFKIAKLHKHVADARMDHLQKVSTDVCKKHAVVYREDLKIRNMTASAAGTLEEPGKNVKRKSGLNRAILDQGWGMLFTMLDYKMAELGGAVYAVPPQYTSQTCPKCGHVSAENRRTQSTFRCTACAYAANADLVASVNILGRGQRLRACGELLCTVSEVQVSRRSRKGRVVQQQESHRRDLQAPQNA